MIINFLCNNPDCGNSIIKFFKKAQDIPPFLDCGQCGTGKLERQLCAPSTKSTQIVDNGIQPKRVELMNAVIEKEKEKQDKGE